MTTLPIAVQALLLVGGAMVVTGLGVLLSRRLMRNKVMEGHNDVLGPIFLMAGTLYAVLLAFLVVVVWQQYGAAQDTVTEEASTVASMYRQTDAMPRAEQQRLHADLKQYTTGVIDEFGVSAYGYDVSDDARKATADMYREFASLPTDQAGTAVSQEFVHDISVVSVDRSKRLIASSENIPTVLWLGMVLGGLVVLAMACSLFMERGILHLVMATSMAGLIGLLLLTAVLLDHPFTGKLQIKPDAFEGTQAVFQAVDNGNG